MSQTVTVFFLSRQGFQTEPAHLRQIAAETIARQKVAEFIRDD